MNARANLARKRQVMETMILLLAGAVAAVGLWLLLVPLYAMWKGG